MTEVDKIIADAEEFVSGNSRRKYTYLGVELEHMRQCIRNLLLIVRTRPVPVGVVEEEETTG